jgi:hypothetical protein
MKPENKYELEYAFSRPLSIDGIRIATFSDAVAVIKARQAVQPTPYGQVLLDRLMGAGSYIEQICAADAFQNWAADELAA